MYYVYINDSDGTVSPCFTRPDSASWSIFGTEHTFDVREYAESFIRDQLMRLHNVEDFNGDWGELAEFVDSCISEKMEFAN